MPSGIDIDENDNEYVVSFQLTGAVRENITIVCRGKSVHVYVVRDLSKRVLDKAGEPPIDDNLMYYKSAVLPGPADIQKATSEFFGGLLEVRLPKLA